MTSMGPSLSSRTSVTSARGLAETDRTGTIFVHLSFSFYFFAVLGLNPGRAGTRDPPASAPTEPHFLRLCPRSLSGGPSFSSALGSSTRLPLGSILDESSTVLAPGATAGRTNG